MTPVDPAAVVASQSAVPTSPSPSTTPDDLAGGNSGSSGGAGPGDHRGGGGEEAGSWLKTRRVDWSGGLFHAACILCTCVGLVTLVVLLIGVAWQSWGWLDWQFLSSFDSRNPKNAGLLAGLWGSIWLLFFTALFSVPIGVGAAVYLEEYSKGTWLTKLIQVNLSNLAGVPSIVYGILGLTVFARTFGIFGRYNPTNPDYAFLGIPLPLGPTVLSGSLTLTLLVLPVIIIATQEALRAIPPSLRHASYALGATKWQTIWYQVLPAAMPGISTGVILALSRAIGETAPLVMIGIPTYLARAPGDLSNVTQVATAPWKLLEVPIDRCTALPLIVFNWISQARREFQYVAAAGIVVLLVTLLAMNGAAIYIRHRFQKRIRW